MGVSVLSTFYKATLKGTTLAILLTLLFAKSKSPGAFSFNLMFSLGTAINHLSLLLRVYLQLCGFWWALQYFRCLLHL